MTTDITPYVLTWLAVTLALCVLIGLRDEDRQLIPLTLFWPLLVSALILAAPFAGTWWIGKAIRKHIFQKTDRA